MHAISYVTLKGVMAYKLRTTGIEAGKRTKAGQPF